MCGRRGNPKQAKYPEEIRDAIALNKPTTYEVYLKYKHICSSRSALVKIICSVCGSEHISNFKQLNRRLVVTDQVCPKCVMSVATSDSGWRKRNSEAQLKIQGTPEQKKKNALGVSKFWRDNPDVLERMRRNLLLTNQRQDVIDRYATRKWNPRGISGDFSSKWGVISFDSSYELATLLALESMPNTLCVTRGPVINYQLDGREHIYLVDFEVNFLGGKVVWFEVKSWFTQTRKDRIEKIKEKILSASEAAKAKNVEFVVVSEENSKEVLGVEMPRGTQRAKMLRNTAHRIHFAKSKHAALYGAKEDIAA
jgi:hypothetical protein